jgi:hypothetical protein
MALETQFCTISWSNSLCEKELLEELLEKGGSPRVRDKGASPRARNKAGSLPLHLAARKASFEASEFLLAKTIDCMSGKAPADDRRLEEGEQASSSALPGGQVVAQSNGRSLTIGHEIALIKSVPTGADMTPFHSHGRLTPLHWAMNRPCDTAFADDFKVFRELVKVGFPLAGVSRYGRTPLSIMAENPRAMHVLCLVFYRLDGADHFALSTANAFHVLQAATCVDDVWRNLNFDRYFGFLLPESQDSSEGSHFSSLNCIHRALVVYFVLQKDLIFKLKDRWLPDEKEVDSISP